MTYMHSMTCHTEGIRPLGPVRWRSLEGSIGVYWDAEAQVGATGYYLSPDPRIVIFFNEVSRHVRMSNRDAAVGRADGRGMARALFVPAGMPVWTRFDAAHRFSHLDLHLHGDRLLKYLSPSIGRSAALAALRRPVELENSEPVEALAMLLVDQVSNHARHPLHAESLAGSIVTGLLDLSENAPEPAGGRLTQAQLNRLNRHIEAHEGRLSVGDMAAAVDLSESWFAHVFKQTTGRTPLQHLQARRIEHAQALLMDHRLSVADIAARLGFCDQAHLTKAFRQIAGETPAAWRRSKAGGPA